MANMVTQHLDQAIFAEFYGWAVTSDILFVAMEYFPLQDLGKHLKEGTPDEEGAKKITSDVLLGLKFMHSEGIIHRDLKPEVRTIP